MLRIREAIVVEGRYDKNTLSQVVDTLILETGGFRIFKDPDQLPCLGGLRKNGGLSSSLIPTGRDLSFETTSKA